MYDDNKENSDRALSLRNSAGLAAITRSDKADLDATYRMMEDVMRKIFTSAALAAAAIWLSQGMANAQWSAPVGHRQPTAQTVPADDSVAGSGISTEHRSVAAAPAKSKAVNPFDDGMDFPNICSNCDQ
jgi:hypothetical protein